MIFSIIFIRAITRTAETNGVECYGFLDGFNGLLKNNATSDEFLTLLNKLREDLGISLDMTKNYLVFNFQFGGKDYESNKN